MVVIAIISLLSSVVLASIKTAREKAVIVKAVSEMKSLQTAVELYRSQVGYYPGTSDTDEFVNYDDDYQCEINCGFGALGNMETLLLELVGYKFISKVPHAPNYPNNCESGCWDNGYFLGYSPTNTAENLFHKDVMTNYFTCGGKKVDNYFIYFYANSKKVNLPKLGLPPAGSYSYVPEDIYCLSM